MSKVVNGFGRKFYQSWCKKARKLVTRCTDGLDMSEAIFTILFLSCQILNSLPNNKILTNPNESIC